MEGGKEQLKTEGRKPGSALIWVLDGGATESDRNIVEQRPGGIDARQQRFPDETPYRYQPFIEAGEQYVWDDAARATMHDYNLLDISI